MHRVLDQTSQCKVLLPVLSKLRSGGRKIFGVIEIGLLSPYSKLLPSAVASWFRAPENRFHVPGRRIRREPDRPLYLLSAGLDAVSDVNRS